MNIRQVARLFIVLAALVGVLSLAVGAMAQEPVAAKPLPAAVGVDPFIRQQFALSPDGQADFFIAFVETADLSAAYSMSWEERGRFVVDTLQAVADQSQANVRKWLAARGIRYTVFWINNTLFVHADEATLNELAAFPEVSGFKGNHVSQLFPDTRAEGSQTTGQTLAPAYPWNITFPQADQVHSQFGIKGQGVVVGGMDTGVEYTHMGLVQNYRGCTNPPTCTIFDHTYSWFDPGGSCGGAPCDTDGHGTATMGIMAGDDDPALPNGAWIGMAPDAQWIHCLGCPYGSCPDADTTACAQWFLAPGGNPNLRPQVVNHSWGLWSPNDCNGNAFQAQLMAYRAADIVPAFAAGNVGDACNTSTSPANNTDPSGNPIAFASGAHGMDGSLDYYSSCGWNACNPSKLFPDVASPGLGSCTTGTGNSYNCSFGGTSSASPHTAGCVALVRSANPALTVAEVEQVIRDAANDVNDTSCGGTIDWNNRYGEGHLNCYAAVQLAGVGGMGFLEGTVTDASTTLALEDATIRATLTPTRTWQTLTDDQGYYFMKVMTGTLSLSAWKYGYQPEVRSTTVVSGMTTTENFALSPAAMYTVDGTVTDAATGWPLYASIAIDGYPYGPVWTDPVSGYYSVTLAQGTYTFTASAWVPGYLPESRGVPVTSNRTEDFALQADLVACVAPGYVSTSPLDDDFDPGGFADLGWTVVNNGGNCVWRDDNPGGRGNNTGGSGRFAIADSDYCGPSGYMDTELQSPPFDVSGMGTVILEFKSDYPYLWTGSDVLDVDVYNGSVWTNVLHRTGVAYPGPETVQLDITAAAGGAANAQVRFHYYNAYWEYWWSVDDVRILGDCLPPPSGGLVVGNVYDNNTGNGLVGAAVENEDGYTTGSQATPADPAVDDGFYTLFSPAGTKTFTATLEGYSTETALVTVVQSDTVSQDFYLGAGYLTFTPSPLTATVGMGQIMTVNASLDNSGTADASFEMQEIDKGFQPILVDGQGEWLSRATEGIAVETNARVKAPILPGVYRWESAAPSQLNILACSDSCAVSPPNTCPQLALENLGQSYTLYYADWAGCEAAINSGAYDLVLVDNSCYAPSDSLFTALNGFLSGGGQVMVNSYDMDAYSSNAFWANAGVAFSSDVSMSPPPPVYRWEPTHPTIADWPSDPLQFDDNYYDDGDKFDVLGNAMALAGYTGAPATGEGAFALRDDNFALVSGFCIDNLAYRDNDSDGTSDCVEVWQGAIAWLLNPASDVPWLSEDPISGTVVAAGSVPVDVTFDASVPEITQPGEYYATLNVKNDTPYGALNVPVTMTVIAPPTYGKLWGWVHGLGYCDAGYYPAEDAEVLVEGSGGLSWTLATNQDGYYQLWLDQANSPLTVTVTYPEHETGQATGIMVYGQQTTTVSFDLRWLVPCLSVDPDSLSADLLMGDTEIQQVTLTNDGAGAAQFEMMEMDRGFQPTLLSIPAFGGELPRSTVPASTGRAPNAPQPVVEPPAPLAFPLAGEPAYALDVYPGYNLVYIPDTTLPGAWTIIGSVPQFHPAADFLNGDFTTLYALDYDTNQFVAIDTATGARTVIGTAVGSGNWTGMTGATDGTLYASSSVCGSSSTLYTVDPASGALTMVGNITNGPCIIDIAINAQGEMYGVDIVNDVLVQIDPATGAGTVIGSVGVDTNYAQGLDFEEKTGVLYWAAYTYQGELRIIDTASGASALVGAFPGGAEVDGLAFATGGGGDVPWLSEDPISGTVGIDGGQTTVDVTFDASVVPQPGEYYATLNVKSNDPVNGKIGLPVTMTVTAPDTWGKLAGVVSGLGHCDGESYPLEDATVVARNGHVMTVTTEADGSYIVWLPEGTYTITASADDHTSNSAVVQITGQQTTTQDLDLRSIQPCVSVTPPSLEVWVLTGTSEVEILTLINDGAGATPFALRETTETMAIHQDLPVYVPPTLVPAPSGGDSYAGGGYPLPEGPGLDAPPPPARYTGPEGLVYYSDRPTFNADNPDLPVEGFENTLVADGNIVACDGPFDIFTNNACFAPGGILDGIRLMNVTPGNQMVVIGDGALGQPSALVGPNTFVDNHDITFFGEDVYAVGFDLWSPLGAATFDLYIYGPNDVLLGQTSVLAATTGTFWGVYADQPITRIRSESAAGAGELFDDIAFGRRAIDVPWLSQDPITGTLEADSTFDVDITFTALPTMPLGAYTAFLIVRTDDAENGEISVPVTMHIVAELPCEPISGVTLTLVTTDTLYPNDLVDFSADLLPEVFDTPYTYTVSLGDGATLGGSDSVDPLAFSHTYTQVGAYTVTIEVWNCDALEYVTDTVQVVVEPVPVEKYYLYLPIVVKNY